MKKILGVMLALTLSLSLPLSAAASIAPAPTQTKQVRLQGSTRYETAISISNELAVQHSIELSLGGKFPNVVLASGNNFPDALAGAPLANQEQAPILLVDSTPEASTATLDYIQANVDTNGKVYLLGGTGVIPHSFTEKLASMGFSTQNILQLGGKDRNETSLIIAKHLKNPTKEAVLVSDSNFTDALTVAPTAVFDGAPILLVAETGLTPDQKALCDSVDIVIVLGELATRTNPVYPKAIGFSGANKYDTNGSWATSFENMPYIALATGEDYPDALAGAVLTGSLGGGVIFLTRPDQLPQATLTALNVNSYHNKQASTIENANGQTVTLPAIGYPTLYILGGTGAVSESVQAQAASILDGPGYGQ